MPIRLPAGLVFWPDGGELKLSYELEGWFPEDEEAGFERVYVDAHKGAVLQRLSLTHPGLNRRVYDFGAACRDRKVHRVVGQRRSVRLARRAMKRHIRSEVSQRGNAEVERLFERFGKVYRFLEATLDMDSLDDRGGTLHGFIGVRVHTTAPPPQCIGDAFNAFWHGGLNAFLLPSAALDYSEIIGHEIGHAIIHWGSGLIYKSQPGALNEAIADAVGVTFRAWLENGGTGLPANVPAQVWQLRYPGGVMRDMRDPASLMDPNTGQLYPDHFDDYRHVSVDNGGVHINSSIMNQGYYLLAMGGQHPRLRSGPAVQGVGLAKALRIFGRAASDLLTPNAGFEAARYAFAAVAEILYGESSTEWVATHTAMDAIGIPGYWDPIEPEPEPEAEPAPQPEEDPAPEPKPAPEPPLAGTRRVTQPGSANDSMDRGSDSAVGGGVLARQVPSGQGLDERGGSRPFRRFRGHEQRESGWTCAAPGGRCPRQNGGNTDPSGWLGTHPPESRSAHVRRGSGDRQGQGVVSRADSPSASIAASPAIATR